jgi:Fe-Mn family superoxide dismutase
MDIRTILDTLEYIQTDQKQILMEGKYTQAKLPYKRTALSPVMSKETLDYHYGKLHKAYVNKANKGEGGDFQVAGAFLHNLFFPQLKSPIGAVSNPSGPSKELIENKHDSFNNFKKAFTEAAMSIQGSGWVYMNTSGNIKIIKNHKVVNNIALLVDWWEHAWVLDYKHDKEKYLDNMWKIINWDIVNNRINGVS